MVNTTELRNIIEEILSEKFKEQEQSLLKIISANAKIQNEKIDSIKNKLNDVQSRIIRLEEKEREFQESLEFTQDIMDKKIETHKEQLEKKMEDIENNGMAVHMTKVKELEEDLRRLEDRNRRNNLRVDGVRENEGESWNETEIKVKKLLRDRLKIDDVIIERAHRMGKKNKDKPRTIIFKLLSYKDKERIMKNRKMLKNTGIFINEDFSDATMKIRKELRIEMKKAREAGKYSVIVYDRLLTREFKRQLFLLLF